MISVLIPYREAPGRQENFVKVLGWYQSVLPRWLTHDEIEIILSDSDPAEPFNRSQARNRAAARATGDVFIFNDADSIVAAPDQISQALGAAEVGGWAFPYSSYITLDEEGLPDKIFPSPQYPEESVGGCVVVTRWAFNRVRGWDERFSGWGEEDRAFAMALATMVAPPARMSGVIVHYWHAHPESERFEQPGFGWNRELCNRYRAAEYKGYEMLRLIQERPDWLG